MHPFYITTPIYYVNANPHLGHAYSTIAADSVTRFHKMLGQKTLFLTGSDEHGDKIVQAAEKKGLSPRQFVDEISSNFQHLWPKLAIGQHYFGRTTDEKHAHAVQAFMQKLYESGDIYFGEFGGFYCYGCERFYTEKELENGLCPQHQKKPEFISEKNYFFRMSKYLPWLAKYIEDHPDMIRPDRYRKEALGMLASGDLEDLCISRPKTRLSWGIELPFDKDYVCYVWFDALLLYITGLGWPDGKGYAEFWPGDHLIAKDILKPHAIFWPCMLKAAGLPIYHHLDVHGYWLSRNTKMSKSLGNVVEPLATSERFGLDAFRYFLLREMRFGSDASFAEDALVARVNAELANDLGNLFSRVLSMNGKYFGGLVPTPVGLLPEDQAIIDLCSSCMSNFIQLFGQMEFSLALDSLWTFVDALNKYVDTQAPWSLFKQANTERLGTVMALLLAGLRKISLCMWPVMPEAACAMLKQLNQEKESANGMDIAPCVDLSAEASSWNWLEPGLALATASNLFPRIELKPEGKKQDKKTPKQKESSHSQSKSPKVDIEAFRSLELRTGTILAAAKHPDADRILRLEIDFGEEKPRQILSALADFYNPDDLRGRKVCAILNLPPRKIRGLVSNGMVLTVEDGDKVKILDPGSHTTNGSIIC